MSFSNPKAFRILKHKLQLRNLHNLFIYIHAGYVESINVLGRY